MKKQTSKDFENLEDLKKVYRLKLKLLFNQIGHLP